MLETKQQQKREADVKSKALALVNTHGSQLHSMYLALGELIKESVHSMSAQDPYPTELCEVIPYFDELCKHQCGTKFLGLDSGFAHLNNLCNGLDTGLTVLAAPPGRGKTSLLWQIGCQAAEINKVPVIFVSMEQSKAELRAKALARFSNYDYRHILRGTLNSEDAQHAQKLYEAITRYAKFANFLTLIEGDANTTIETIQQVAAMKMAKMGAGRCLIAIDYLQILPLQPDQADLVTNTKDRIDMHVSALRRMARELDSPVIAISAENRAGYTAKDLKVFKESGGIEYSADIAMILTRDKQNDPVEDCRRLDLNIIKNRNGECGTVRYKFYAKRMEFVETGKGPPPVEVEE